MTRYTIVETNFGYNVQIMYRGIVVANCSDGVLSVAQRYAENQASAIGLVASKIKKDFITLK